MKNFISRIVGGVWSPLALCVVGLTLSLLGGLSAVNSAVAVTPAHSAQMSGGYYDPVTGTQDAIYASANGQTGVVSRTTATAHEWGFVTQAQYVSANEVIVTALQYGTENIIVEDMRADTQSVSFAVYDPDGALVAGSADLLGLRGRIVIR